VAATSDPIEQKRLEALVGNPAEKLLALKERIQGEFIRTFKEVEADFLDLLWTVDTYRVERVVPRAAAGTKIKAVAQGGEGIYRTKGNFFSEVITAILSNKTSSQLAPRSKVQGFSQTHQIDIAWPARNSKVLVDPLICCEAKLTGAPAYEDKPARKGLADWSNRRKELKFQATDLKLYRQAANTKIHNWDQWRKKAAPLVYTLWAARLEDFKELTKMVSEAQVLTATYSDGVGIFGFVVNAKGNGYVPASPATAVAERVTSLDTVLNLIAAEIQSVMEENDDQVPAPIVQKNLNSSTIDDVDEMLES
jgi:hypothetical protein